MEEGLYYCLDSPRLGTAVIINNLHTEQVGLALGRGVILGDSGTYKKGCAEHGRSPQGCR